MNLTIIPEYSRTKDNVHVVYQNNKQADVTFKENNDRVYTGGSEATDDLTIPRSLSDYTLYCFTAKTKNQTSLIIKKRQSKKLRQQNHTKWFFLIRGTTSHTIWH